MIPRSLSSLVLSAALLLAAAAAAWSQPVDSGGVTTIVVPAPDGRVAWDDVLAALAVTAELDGDALRPWVPHGTLDLSSRRARLALAACNLAFDGAVVFRSESDDQGEPQLRVEVDRERLQRRVRRLKTAARERLAGDGRAAEYGLSIDDDWQERPADQPLVVFIHGYNGSRAAMEPLAEALGDESLICGYFTYPNDGPLDEAARSLSGELRGVAGEQPGRRVVLVAHSMGGLVARCVVEDPDLDPGCVEQLVLIAPPNHGSELARLPVSVDAWEQLARQGDAEREHAWTRMIADGLGEARDDLKPGSAFLTRVNARPRNPRVAYTILLGDGGPLDERQVAALSESWDRCEREAPALAVFGPRVEPCLRGEELCRGRGDGAVSLASGRLEGVQDVVVLPFRHDVLVRGLETEAGRRLVEEVRRRIAADP